MQLKTRSEQNRFSIPAEGEPKEKSVETQATNTKPPPIYLREKTSEKLLSSLI